MNNVQKKPAVELSGDQARYRDDFVAAMKNRKRGKTTARIISSSPGSGKTTLIEQSIKSFVEGNPGVVDDMLDMGEKILVLVFNKINKKEIEQRFKKAEFPMDLFEISTVNSLFFRHAKTLTDIKNEKGVLGTFQLDYTKAFFTKESVKEIVGTLCKGGKLETKLGEAEEKLLSKTRSFSEDILTEKNIEIVWALLNAYFASSYQISNRKEIEREAKFFGKKEVSFDDLAFSKEDKELLDRMGRNIKTPQEVFLKVLIKRVNDLANYREVENEFVIVQENVAIPIVTEEEGPDGEIIEVENVMYQNMDKKKLVQKYHNIITVPHSYYFKEFLNHILKDENLMKKLYGHFRAVIVDEGQDNTRSFLNFLIKAGIQNVISEISVIGDSLQRIYGFNSPDNFDMLSFCVENTKVLSDMGIEVMEYDLHQTYRFGEQISNYTNDIFKGSKVIGKPGTEDFISPDMIKSDDFVKTVKQAAEYGSTAIICRSNAAAAEMFVRMKEGGHANVRLETSAKKEISDFARKGIDAIEDKNHKKILTNIINKFRRENENFAFKTDILQNYEEILACGEATKFLRNAGYAKLVQFDLEQVENYLIPAQRGGSAPTWIGTPYPFKGQEYDAVFMGTDHLKKNFSGEYESRAEMDFSEYEHEAETEKSPAKKIGINLSALFGEAEAESEVEAEAVETNMDEVEEYEEDEAIVYQDFGGKSFIQEILESPESGQEKAVLFVAVTRAKKGVFFEASAFAECMLSDFVLDAKLNRERARLYLAGGKERIESILKEEKETLGLFAFPK